MLNKGLTTFQQDVYNVISTIPRGKVSTYKEVATVLGCGSSQAVGQALKANPFAPRVPCHRVIRSDLTPGGYSGMTEGPALQRKIKLLAEEGVRFSGNQLIDSSRVFHFRKR